MVDGTYRAASDESGSGAVYQPRSQKELDKLAAIVGNTVGFDVSRNDRIEMVNVPFDRKDLQDDREALDSMYMQDYYRDMAGKFGLGLLALIALIWMRRSLAKFFAALGKIVSSTAN